MRNNCRCNCNALLVIWRIVHWVLGTPCQGVVVPGKVQINLQYTAQHSAGHKHISANKKGPAKWCPNTTCMPSSANFADAFYTVVPLFMFVMKAFFIIDRYLVQKICFSFGSFSADKHIEDIIQNIASLPPPTKRREEDMPKSTKTMEWIIVSGGPVGSFKSCSGWNNSST